LEKKGWVERIEKGKYMVIPLGARKGEYTLNEFVIGSLLVDPSAIAYWSALNYHGLTEQIPATIFVQTTSRKKKQELEIFGVRYRIVRIKEGKFFGIEKVWLDEFQVNVTDREKTIVDCLDKPGLCGGVIEVAKALKHGEFDFEKLSEYAIKIGNSGVVRRLGYLCDVLGLKINLPEVKAKNYLLLDPTMPKKGETNGKWRLIINLDIGELE
jgi:predicted transcriptional regulator of viral defense system